MTKLSTESFLQTLEQIGLEFCSVRPLRVLCAVSGGLDSMVLLHLMSQSGLPVRAVHVDHDVHSESAKWADWVRLKSSDLNIPVTVHRLAKKAQERSNLEELWRDARRDVFISELEDGEVLMTAHHQDDQLETLLLQLVRGAGPTGLQSMPLHRPLANMKSHVRPLLSVSRDDLAAYADEHGVEFLNDPSNANTHFDRNYLRHVIVPTFKERWPSVGQAAARSAELIAEAVGLNETLAKNDFSASADGQSLNWQPLERLDLARQANAVRYWLRTLHVRMPNRARLTEALRQWNEATSDKLPKLQLESGTVEKYRSRLVYQRLNLEPLEGWTGALAFGHWMALPDGEGQLGLIDDVSFNAQSLSAAEYGPVIRQDRLESVTLTVRYRKNGERLRRAAGHHQKLKHWFQQNNVPPVRRSRLPLVFFGDELIAIATIWVDARFRWDAASDSAEKSCRLIWRDLSAD